MFVCPRIVFSALCAAGVVLAGTAEAAKGPVRKPGALVLRFDDNKPVSQWRELAEIFEAIGGRCSFAVNAGGLSEEQWKGLRELSERGHEVIDHTGQHAVFKLLLDSPAEAEKLRTADFFDQGKSVDEVYEKAVGVIRAGHTFAYISHQWTDDRARYLAQCRELAARLKENGIRMTTYAHVAE